MRSNKERSLFHAVNERRFGKSTCFLCGRRLGSKNRTVEHVIPLWVQKRFDLLSERLILLNGTEIPYRQLTIPCCYNCNHDSLAPIEQEVQQAIELGATAVRELNQHILFLWLGKIFYGILYKELFLHLDRRQPKRGSILRREDLQRFEMHHLFLQSARVEMEFSGFSPASIFIFETQAPPVIKLQYDFRDSLPLLFVAIRLGNVGIISTLQDGGALAYTMSPLQDTFKDLPLHPLQFREIVARLLYQATLFNRTPKYLLSETNNSVHCVQMPLGGLSTKPLYDEHSWYDYANILAQVTGYPLEKAFQPPDSVLGWLHNPDRSIRYMLWNEFPIIE